MATVTGYTKDGTDAAIAVVAATKVDATDAVALATAASGQDPAAPGTADIGTLAAAARADHVHPSAGLYWWLGSGTQSLVFDGTATVSYVNSRGNTINFTPTGGVYSLSEPIYVRNLTIGVGATVRTQGSGVFVSGTATIGGTLHANGSNATGATGGAGHPVTSNHLCDGGSGAAGGTGAGAVGGVPLRNSIGRTRLVGGGGVGGASGASAGGAGGSLSGNVFNDGFASSLLVNPLVVTSGFFLAGTAGGVIGAGGGGGAGAGDGTNAGGAGGGGGGSVLLNCARLAGSGTISANGGNGGNAAGGNGGGGGAGGGGWVFVNTADIAPWTGTISAAGGTPGTGSGTGGSGANPTGEFLTTAGLVKLSVYR